MSIIVPILAIVGVVAILVVAFVVATIFLPPRAVRLVCRLTGGHRWIVVDDYHDRNVLKQCKVCCAFSYSPGGVPL